jgi:5S rRNA maturation endonuclease (ribonuclease M5)
MLNEMRNGRGAVYTGRPSSPSSAEYAVYAMLDNVRKMDGWRWSARCPAHDDKDNSLSVWYDGELLSFKCHAGCSPKDVTDILYEKYPEYAELLGRAPKNKKDMEKERVKESAATWYANYLSVAPDFLYTLPITFTDNEIIFRFSGIDKYKVRIKGERGAFWRGQGHTPDLWPLPKDKVGEDIVLTEGESDCIVARALGLEAYAITKGAASGLPTSVLIALRRRGARRVVVAMDADTAGRQAASKIVMAARQAGLAAIDLDLVAEGLIEPLLGHKDIRDAHKYDKGQELVEVVRHLLYRADEARPVQPRKLSEIMTEERPTDFIIEGLLRLGGTTILVGEPKLGKSQMALDIALAVARGEQFVGLSTKKGRVIYYALEDGEDIIRDRVRARGLTGMEEDLYICTTPPVVEDSTEILEEHIDLYQPNLIIIDTLRAMSVSAGKSENEASFADSIYRIAKLARERGIGAIIIHHTVKATTGNPIADARGTSAIAGAVDVVAGLYKYEDKMKLSWRGRFGAGDKEVNQLPNGSFNYQAIQVPNNVNNEEYLRRIEERLNKYYEACIRFADKYGKVDVARVVAYMWGTENGRYKSGSWDKTYKALDELVKRQKLRKKDRQYYVIKTETSPSSSPTNRQADENSRQTSEAKVPTNEKLKDQEIAVEPANNKNTEKDENKVEASDGNAPPGGPEVETMKYEGAASSHHNEDNNSETKEEPPPVYIVQGEKSDGFGIFDVVTPEKVISRLKAVLASETAKPHGELTAAVIEAGNKAVALMEDGKYEEAMNSLEGIRDKLRQAHAEHFWLGENVEDLNKAIELFCRVLVAIKVLYYPMKASVNVCILATKTWKDIEAGRISASDGLRIIRDGNFAFSDLMPALYDCRDIETLGKFIRALRANLPMVCQDN